MTVRHPLKGVTWKIKTIPDAITNDNWRMAIAKPIHRFLPVTKPQKSKPAKTDEMPKAKAKAEEVEKAETEEVAAEERPTFPQAGTSAVTDTPPSTDPNHFKHYGYDTKELVPDQGPKDYEKSSQPSE